MNILDALLPTHAALHAATASRITHHASHPPTQLKYVIVQSPDGRHHPILGSPTIPHSHLVPRGHTPVSAGFALIYANQIQIPQIPSITLNLGPKPHDPHLIRSILNIQ